MAEIVITNKPSISQLWAAVSGAMLGSVLIKPSAYVGYSYNLLGGASDNWDEVVVAIDMMNIHQSNEHLNKLDQVADFLKRKLANKQFMQKEFGSWIYLELHVEPTIVQLYYARKFAAALGGVWIEIAAGLEKWLRALCGWLAITGCWERGKMFSQPYPGPGARLIEGIFEFNKRLAGARYCVFAGKRSWHYDIESKSYSQNIWAPIYLSSLALNEDRVGGDILPLRILESIRKLTGKRFSIVTAQESSQILAAINNDPNQIVWCVRHLIQDWLPAASPSL